MTQRTCILIGHNFNSILGLARALGVAGYDVKAIRTGFSEKKNFLNSFGRTPESKSKYISEYITADSKDPESIIHILLGRLAKNGKKAILFPVDDISAMLLDQNYDRLSEHFFLPNVNGKQGGVLQLIDKYYQKQLAKSVGLPVPEGWSIEIKNGEYFVPDDIRYPCFAKAEMPMRARKNYMGKCSSREELVQLLDKATDYQDCVMLVEEFVDIEKEFGSVGVCNGENVCIPGITEKISLGHGSHAGVTACGKIHAPNKYPETVEKMKLMMAKSGLNGIFDIDLYESKGVLYFNELNVRLGAEGVGTLIAGVNLAKMFADSFEDMGDIDYSAEAREITFANEKPLISDFGEGYISWSEYKTALHKSEKRFILSENDKGPYRDYAFYVMRQIVRKLKRKIKG